MDAATLATVTTGQFVVILAVGLFFGAALYEIVLHSTPWGIGRLERRHTPPIANDVDDEEDGHDDSYSLEIEEEVHAKLAGMYFSFTADTDGTVHLARHDFPVTGDFVTLCGLNLFGTGRLGSGDTPTCPECLGLRMTRDLAE